MKKVVLLEKGEGWFGKEREDSFTPHPPPPHPPFPLPKPVLQALIED